MMVKTDRKDARGLAQLIRMGWFRPVHAKSMGSLAPLAPLADALALSWSRSTTLENAGASECGWVRGLAEPYDRLADRAEVRSIAKLTGICACGTFCSVAISDEGVGAHRRPKSC